MGSWRPRSVALLAAVALTVSAAGVFSFWVNPHSVSPLLAIAVILSVGILARLRRPGYRPATLFLWWCVTLAGYLASVYGTFVFPLGRVLDIWCLIFVTFYFFLSPAFLAFALSLAEVHTRLSRTIIGISLVVAAAFTLMRFSGVWRADFIDVGIKRTIRGHRLYAASLVYVQLSYCYGLFEVLRNCRRLPAGDKKERLKWFIIGSAITNVLAYVNPLLSFGVLVYPLSAIILSLYGIFLAYLIVRLRFLEVEVVIRKAAIYGVYVVTLGSAYTALLLAVSVAVEPLSESWVYLKHGALIVAVGFLAVPLRSRVQDMIDRKLFRDQYDRRKALGELAESMVTIIDLEALQGTVLESLVQTVKIEAACIYTVTSSKERETLVLSATKAFAEPIRFMSAGDELSPLTLSEETVRALREASRSPFLVAIGKEDGEGPPQGLPQQLEELAVGGGYELVLPIASGEKTLALILLGKKLSELPYSREDMDLLESVAAHAYAAFDNALNYEATATMQSYTESILRSLDSGILTVNLEGRMESFNEAARRKLGLRAGGADHRMYGEVLGRYPEFCSVVTLALTNQHVTGRELVCGETMLSVTTTQLVGVNGEVTGVLIAFTDITETKKLAALLKRNEHLATLGEMATYVAHEIKNPITSMRLLASALPNRLTDRSFVETAAEVIPAEVNRLDRIVRGLLDYARPAALLRTEVDLVATTKSSVEVLRPEIKEKGVLLTETYDLARRHVNADGEKIKQVLVNMIKNAVEAVSSRERRTVGIRAFRKDRTVAVSVSDSGVGMTEEEQKKLFRPFFSTKRHGTGLGLAISHKIVEEHGGRIEVESSLGVGSTFTVVLPTQGQAAHADVQLHTPV